MPQRKQTKPNGVSRREFLMISSCAAISVSTPLADVLAAIRRASAKSRVVEVSSEEVLAPDRRPVAEIVQQMLDEGMKALTGKRSVADAWREFVSPREVVGVKFNGVSRDFHNCNQIMLEAIAKGLMSAGVRRSNIVPIETSVPQGMKRPLSGFDTEIDYGAGKTCLRKYLTQQIDVLINVPDLKDHGGAGVTISMKNLYGCVNNPFEMHDGNCDPYIAYVNALPIILEKRRLNICNGIRGIFQGGPRTEPQNAWDHRAIIISTDPVALDTIGLGYVEEQRKRRGIRPIGDRARHIQTAASIGLGTNDRARIDHVKISLEKRRR